MAVEDGLDRAAALEPCGQSATVENRWVTVEVCYGPSYGIAMPGHLRCDIVEGHRYADDAEPSWYSGKGQYDSKSQYNNTSQYDPDVSGSHAIGNPYDSGVHERPSSAFRLPEQRPSDPPGGYALTDPLITTGSHAHPADARVPVRGPEYPTIKPPEAPQPPTTPMAEPTSLVPPVIRQPETVIRQPETAIRQPETVYQTRRPVSSIIVAIVMIVLMVPVVRLLVEATFTGSPNARAIVPAVLLTLGFALSGIGLFAIAKGGPISREAWLRPPVAYLPAGLVLLLAAGLAVA
jgi:hypothetical protein